MLGRLLPGLAAGLAATVLAGQANALDRSGGPLDAMIARHAQANGVPEDLVHRVVIRESRYNPRAVGRGGAMGLMQIKHGTARAMGYTGPASGLLDAETNLTYAVRYLAGAYRVAGGNPGRAVSYYARGYYYEAKRRGIAGSLAAAPVEAAPSATVASAAAALPAAAGAPAVAALEAVPQASAFLPTAGRGSALRTIAVLPPARPAAFGGVAAIEARETASVAAEEPLGQVERSHN